MRQSIKGGRTKEDILVCVLKHSSSALLRFTVGAGLLLACLSAWPIARHPDANEALPAGLVNATVRVRTTSVVGRVEVGSGTVIKIHRDATGPGGWLCVLTADHVVGHGIAWSIGFGNIRPLDPWHYHVPGPDNMVRGDFDEATQTWVDLAMLGVRVPDLSRLPPLILPEPSAEVHTDVIQKGFGDTGVIDVAARRYNIVRGYGTYRNGKNSIDQLTIFRNRDSITRKTYEFVALQGDLDFSPGPPRWPPNEGESHFLSGDSGGPSVQHDRQAQVWRLVGVHTVSDTDRAYTVVGEGNLWWDVRVGSYLDWVNRACQQVIPEPASVTALSAGLLFLLASRSRKKK